MKHSAVYKYSMYIKNMPNVVPHSQKAHFSGVKGMTLMRCPWTHPLFLEIWSNVFPDVLLDCIMAKPTISFILEIQMLRSIYPTGAHWAHCNNWKEGTGPLYSFFLKVPTLDSGHYPQTCIQLIKSWEYCFSIHWESKVEVSPHFFSSYKILLIKI